MEKKELKEKLIKTAKARGFVCEASSGKVKKNLQLTFNQKELLKLISEELDKARKEGEIEVLTEIFQTCYQEDSKTLELVEEKLSKLKDNKRYGEERRNGGFKVCKNRWHNLSFRR